MHLTAPPLKPCLQIEVESFEGACVEERHFRSPGRWHLWSFPCPLMESLHLRRPISWSVGTCPWCSLDGCLESPSCSLCTLAELQEELGNYMGQFPQDSGMHLSGSCRLMYIQVPQVVVNLTFMYNGRDFASPLPILLFIYSRGGKTGWH